MDCMALSKWIRWLYFHGLGGSATMEYLLDEFLLTTISECERNDLFEVIQSRTDKKSTIYCSQWAPEGWLGKLGDEPLTDAILDRIRNSSYTILLKGRSLREDYSKIR